MTFLEAAIEILRRADAAMHYSDVARAAVEENLLSHVGRDPETAMRSCLNSAVRGDEPIIVREKPGYYGIRPGAPLPDPPPRPEPKPVEKAVEKTGDSDEISARPSRSGSASRPARPSKDSNVNSKGRGRSAKDDPTTESEGRKRRRRTPRAKGEAPAPASVEVLPVRKSTEKKAPPKRVVSKDDDADEAVEDESVKHVEFEAPTGSGLDGVTDVALVMANAMSRLVEERPELKDELDALQQTQKGGTEEPAPMAARRPPRNVTSREREMREREARERDEERSGRRRRRRRRRGKRVDWSAGTETRAGDSTVNDNLLDGVASVLAEAGSRSLHVRQIAETLASRGVLGGEISEIERAVTAAVMVDIHERGRGSRFVARGDARYQLQGGRLPDPVAKAEQALRDAALHLEGETRVQLVQWLQSLGARALESLVRVYLTREGYQLIAALPPSRGIGKLVIEDVGSDEDEGRQLVLVVPKRTPLETKLWEGELERNACTGLTLFSMADIPDELQLDDARVIGAEDLGRWMRQHRVGVQPLQVEALALEPTFIESIAGLDT
jgi:hypothetical protein